MYHRVDYDKIIMIIKLALWGFIAILFLLVYLRYRLRKKRLERFREEQRLRNEARERALEDRQRKKDIHNQFVAEQRRLMTDKLRYEILKRDGFRCQICGATQKDGVRLHVDHIYPVSKGGRTEPDNLRTLCERCNMGKGDSIEQPHSEGSDDFEPPTFAIGYRINK